MKYTDLLVGILQENRPPFLPILFISSLVESPIIFFSECMWAWDLNPSTAPKLPTAYEFDTLPLPYQADRVVPRLRIAHLLRNLQLR